MQFCVSRIFIYYIFIVLAVVKVSCAVLHGSGNSNGATVSVAIGV